MLSQRWRLIARTAERQYGVVSHEQLFAAGFTRNTIATAVANGHLLCLHRAVYALGHLPTDQRADRLAATLALGPRSSISHRVVFEHHRLLPRRRGDIDVTVPAMSGRRRRRGLVIHRARLAPDERIVVEKVRCTTISRALLDLAATHPWDLEKAIKTAGADEKLRIGECMKLIDRYRGRPGAPLLRRLLIGEDGLPVFTKGELERRMFRLCRSAGLPLPQMNVDVPSIGDVYECDCVWPEYRLIVECDSRWHDNPITSVGDAERDQALTLAGWRVHRLRWAQIVGEPEVAARTIRHLLAEQARLLGRAA